MEIIQFENLIENNDKSFNQLKNLQLLILKDSGLKKLCKKKNNAFL